MADLKTAADAGLQGAMLPVDDGSGIKSSDGPEQFAAAAPVVEAAPRVILHRDGGDFELLAGHDDDVPPLRADEPPELTDRSLIDVGDFDPVIFGG